MEIKGRIIDIFDHQQVTDTFRKREFVVEYADNPQYPELIKMELVQNNCDQLDQFNIGDEVIVSFNIKGRKWSKDGKDVYFTTLQAWRILWDREDQPEPKPTTQEPAPKPKPFIEEGETPDDDLPF